MQLYHSKTSPFVRKVEVALIETGLHPGVEMIPSVGTPVAPGSMPTTVNPLGKVPCLVLKDGSALYDSRVITRYLDTLTEVKLYPDGAELWDTLRMEALADGMMEATLLIAFESRLRPEEQRSPKWVDGQWAKVARTMASIEQDWMGQLAGPLDMGQIGIAIACDYADLRAAERKWRDVFPVLSAWQSKFAERDSMKRTVPVT